MKIVIELDEAYSKVGAINYFKAINIDDDLVKSVKFETD